MNNELVKAVGKSLMQGVGLNLVLTLSLCKLFPGDKKQGRGTILRANIIPFPHHHPHFLSPPDSLNLQEPLMEVWRNIILFSSLSPEYYSELTPSSFPSAFAGRVPSLVVSLHPRSPHNNPSHSIITPPFSTPCHQPPCQAGCRLAISCTRSVEPLSGVEC